MKIMKISTSSNASNMSTNYGNECNAHGMAFLRQVTMPLKGLTTRSLGEGKTCTNSWRSWSLPM